jgi:hypothetical protein
MKKEEHMRKSNTIGKTKVENAARERGLFLRRVNTADGRSWEVTNGKSFRAYYPTLESVWNMVRPRPVALPGEEEHEENGAAAGDPVHAEHGAGGVA